MKILFTKGNKKLPKTTYILNVGSALNCPSDRLGLCEVSKGMLCQKGGNHVPGLFAIPGKTAQGIQRGISGKYRSCAASFVKKIQRAQNAAF